MLCKSHELETSLLRIKLPASNIARLLVGTLTCLSLVAKVAASGEGTLGFQLLFVKQPSSNLPVLGR